MTLVGSNTRGSWRRRCPARGSYRRTNSLNPQSVANGPMSHLGQSRRFHRPPMASDLLPERDTIRVGRHVSKVPEPEIGYYWAPNEGTKKPPNNCRGLGWFSEGSIFCDDRSRPVEPVIHADLNDMQRLIRNMPLCRGCSCTQNCHR
jgi:hypothetical protein